MSSSSWAPPPPHSQPLLPRETGALPHAALWDPNFELLNSSSYIQLLHCVPLRLSSFCDSSRPGVLRPWCSRLAQPIPPSCYIPPPWHESPGVLTLLMLFLLYFLKPRLEWFSHGYGESYQARGRCWVSSSGRQTAHPFELGLHCDSTCHCARAFPSPGSSSHPALGDWERNKTLDSPTPTWVQ